MKMSYSKINKEHWDVASIIHKDAPKGYYDIKGFKVKTINEIWKWNKEF